jgi:hypothetical protein
VLAKEFNAAKSAIENQNPFIGGRLQDILLEIARQ